MRKRQLAITLLVTLFAALPARAQLARECSVPGAAGGTKVQTRFTVVSTLGQPPGYTVSSGRTFTAVAGFFGCALLAPMFDTDGDGLPDEIDPDNDNDGTPDARDSDQDGDSLPDLWELGFFNTLAVADQTTDNDADERLDLHEFIANTVPTDAESFFAMELQVLPGNPPRYEVSYFPTFPSRRYHIFWSDSLLPGAWTELTDGTTVIADPLRTTTDSNRANALRRFYRIDIELSP